MEDPPNSIFASIDASYDSSITYYFSILKWNTILMLLFAALNIPTLLFSMSGDILYGQTHFSMESLSLANISASNSSNFPIIVTCDAIGTFLFFLVIIYLRYKGLEQHIKGKVTSVSPWSVEISGFPSATIDPEDLRPILFANVHEIYLVRNYQGSLQLMKKKAHLERLIRLETKKLDIQSKKYSQAEIYIRQDYIRVLRNDVQDKVKELGEKFNLFLAPEDLESIRAYVVFKSKDDRDQFFHRYNNDCLSRNGIFLCYKQSPELQLRSLYTIKVKAAPDPSEIKWDNMDFINKNKTLQKMTQVLLVLLMLIPLIILINLEQKQATQDPLICMANRSQSNCLQTELDATRLLMVLVAGLWIYVGNELGIFFLDLIIIRERQIYIVREQKNILWRLFLYSLVFAFIFPYLLSLESIGDMLYIFSPHSSAEKALVYSTAVDRKWLLNNQICFIWVSIFYTLTYILAVPLTRCYSLIDQSPEDLQLIGSIMQEEFQTDEERYKLNTTKNQNNSSNQTLFLLNLDESNHDMTNQNLDLLKKKGRALRRDSQIINQNSNFMTGERYARILFIDCLALFLSPTLPLVPFLAFLQLLSFYLTDKYLLLYYHSYNEQQQIKLQDELKSLGVLFLRWLTVIVIIHIIIALEIYGYPGFFEQNSMGANLKWSDYDFKILYKIGTIIPLTILLGIGVLGFVADFIFLGKGNHKPISDQVDQEFSALIDDHIQNLRELGAMVSYNLKYHHEFRDIISSQKQESIRATLNQFKH